MKNYPVVLFVSDESWRLGVIVQGQVKVIEIPGPLNDSVENRVQALQECLASKNLSTRPVVLAIPSAWCLYASISTNDIAKNDVTAMLYALEEHLPIAAEEVVADFIWQGQKAIGICSLTGRLSSLVALLESRQWSVISICPVALLALEHWLGTESNAQCNVIVAAENQQWVILSLAAGNLKSWNLVNADINDLQLQLDMLSQSTDRPVHLLLHECPREIIESLRLTREDSSVTCGSQPIWSSATIAASTIVSGRKLAPVDLVLPNRRTAIGRRLHRPFAAAISGLVILLVCCMIALLIAGHRIDQQTDHLKAQQAELFRQVVPNPKVRVPQQVSRYLASELQRLNGTVPDSKSAGLADSAFQTLMELFIRMPDQVPLQLNRVHVESDRVELAGQLRTHEDAGRLAVLLGADGHFAVPPPRTTAGRSSGVNFTLELQRADSLQEKVRP